MKTIAGLLLAVPVLSGCAIEGIGTDGRTLAYQNAASESREYVALNRGQRDARWYAAWCDKIRPHFAHMSEQDAKLDRYCSAMQQQPEHAAEIQRALVEDLSASGEVAQQRSSQALNALALYSVMQSAQPRAATPAVTAPVTCTSQAIGSQTYTNCR